MGSILFRTVGQSPVVLGQRKETLVEEWLCALKPHFGFHGNKPEVVLTSWGLKATDILSRESHHVTNSLQAIN